MPGKKNNKGRRGNRRSNKRKGGARMSSGKATGSKQSIPGVAVNLPLMSAFNLRHKARLRYADVVTIGTFGVTAVGWVFSANGLYDPDITGTGHQPLGFDQLMTFFNHYTVTQSWINVTFLNSATNTPCMVALSVQRASSPLSSYQRVLECGDAVFGNCGAITGSGGPPGTVLRHHVKVANFQSIPNVLNDDTLRGTAAANPATQMYFVLYVTGLTTSDQSISAQVVIDFEAVFTEPLQPAQS